MPLYIADYLKDTTHLGALESGAYLHLIMDYWQNGKLPADDKLLARISKLTEREWRKLKPVLQAFFHDGWKHKRIDEELAEVARIAESNAGKARDAANKRWSKHKEKPPQAMPQAMPQACLEHTPSNAPECTLHTSPFTKEEKKEGGAEAPTPLYAFSGKTIRLNQVDYDRWREAYYAIEDFDAELQAADDYYTANPPKDGKWFFPVSNWLKKEHAKALERRKQAKKASEYGDTWM